LLIDSQNIKIVATVEFHSVHCGFLRMKLLRAFIQFMLIHICMSQFRKFAIQVDERIENCAPKDQDAKAFDLSEFEIVALSDLDVFINGTMKIIRRIESPVQLQIYAERFYRGQWNSEVVNMKRPDFCTALHDPKETWYMKLNRLKECPLDVGVRT
jgi:hypothetical protein